MSENLSHDAALDCIVGAAGVTVLSYEEAIAAYFRLRGLQVPPDDARLKGVAIKSAADGEASKPKARATEPRSSPPANHTEESKP